MNVWLLIGAGLGGYAAGMTIQRYILRRRIEEAGHDVTSLIKERDLWMTAAIAGMAGMAMLMSRAKEL